MTNVLLYILTEKIDTQYIAEMTLISKKMRTDSLGKETPIAINEWVEVGFYKNDSALYLKQHFFSSDTSVLTIKLKEIPEYGGIDPRLILIDKNITNNTKKVKETSS